jgi:spermidine synthase
MIPWQSIDKFQTSEGPIELRRRGGDWLITIAGRVLMSSQRRASEQAMAKLAIAASAKKVLVAGLGMGLTLRAALDALGPSAKVTVRELHDAIAGWCRGPLAEVNGGAALDPRVTIEIGDVREAFPRAWDTILLDLYEGPYDASGIFGPRGLAEARAGLAPGGVYSVWSEAEDKAFEKRLRTAFGNATRHTVQGHTVWIAKATAPASR